MGKRADLGTGQRRHHSTPAIPGLFGEVTPAGGAQTTHTEQEFHGHRGHPTAQNQTRGQRSSLGRKEAACRGMKGTGTRQMEGWGHRQMTGT